ncbi:MAG: sodium:solute symporter [Candidatus Marinimicrobia bacterium]|nr:sodium:solute symporter [Candidatus Neomarinimicrobiota bacterium]
MENYGWISILPPILAILLSIKTRQVYISLFAGIWIGWLVMSGWNPILGTGKAIDSLVHVFESPGNTRVIIFSALVGSLIALMQASGGVKGFVSFVLSKKWMKSPLSAQLLAWILGILIFIESSIKILIVGTTCRPIFDHLKISREKLAYIADSTSAAICMLIPLNAWGALIIGLLTAQNVPNPTTVLLQSIGLNFYAIVTVLMVLILILFRVDFGRMKKAEERAATGQILPENSHPMVDENIIEMEARKGVTPRAINMLVPIIIMSLFMPVALLITGQGNLTRGSGSTSVLWSVLLAITVAALMYRFQRIMKLSELMDVIMKGAGGMISLAILMVLAFSLGETCKFLGTGRFVAGITSGVVHPSLIPLLIFLASSFVAFSTGTSFGTFALMMPLAISFVGKVDVNLPLLVSAILGGGVFGDHCSPISDTTIVSSMASACDHIDHVNTQLPYALIAAGISSLFYMIAGFVL